VEVEGRDLAGTPSIFVRNATEDDVACVLEQTEPHVYINPEDRHEVAVALAFAAASRGKTVTLAVAADKLALLPSLLFAAESVRIVAVVAWPRAKPKDGIRIDVAGQPACYSVELRDCVATRDGDYAGDTPIRWDDPPPAA
jgi:hypothetical protein